MNIRTHIARYAILTIALLPISLSADEVRIRAFTSDGCSAWPDGTLFEKKLWLRCCVVHDVAYWQGGTREERKEADEALRQCVAEVGEPEIAAVMLAGVRVGGSPYWPTSFRWGYGWEWPRGYRALTPDERVVVDQTLSETGVKLPAEAR